MEADSETRGREDAGIVIAEFCLDWDRRREGASRLRSSSFAVASAMDCVSFSPAEMGSTSETGLRVSDLFDFPVPAHAHPGSRREKSPCPPVPQSPHLLRCAQDSPKTSLRVPPSPCLRVCPVAHRIPSETRPRVPVSPLPPVCPNARTVPRPTLSFQPLERPSPDPQRNAGDHGTQGRGQHRGERQVS